MSYSQIVSVTDGGSAPSGCIGEVIRSVVSSVLGSGFTIGNFGNITSITVTPGIWLVSGSVGAIFVASVTRNIMAISLFSANTTTDHVVGSNLADVPLGVNGGLSGTNAIVNFPVTVTASSTVYLKSQLTGAVGDILTGNIIALRIR